MRWAAVILIVGASLGRCQIRDVVKSAEIDRMFADTRLSREVLVKNNYAVDFRVGASGRQTSADADEFWFVRSGAADITLDGRKHRVDAGDVVSVPRTAAYRITLAGARFGYVAVRIFPTERRLRIGIGAAPEPHPMPDVAAKAQIDATLTTADKNTLLHSAGALLINHVIYKAAPGPHEVHQTCDDLYFVRMGTAHAKIDGTLVNGKEDQPGEIRGTDVRGAREFAIGPGDMVSIPRNTAHFMDPGSTRLGYLLVKVCD